MTDLLNQSATKAAQAIRDGRLSSRDLVDAQLAQIDRLNPPLNALVEVHRDAALLGAEQADRAVRRGDPLGPLHGVPITLKEAFQARDYHSTWGDPHHAHFTPAEDAAVPARLKAAGAILVGTSNVAAMLADFAQSDNPVYGSTKNPWDQTRVPGGSTGGGAAAVAAGLSFLDYGSDVTGSVRLPAAFCGVYGLRATPALVSGRGFQPPGVFTPVNERATQVSFGPLARSAADLRTALAVTAGPDALMTPQHAWPLVPPRHRRLQDFRVGVVLDHPAAPVTGEVGAVLSNVVDALTRAGVTVREGWPAGYDPQLGAEAFGLQLQWYFALMGEPTRLSLQQVLAGEQQRLAARHAWQAFFADHDVFLSPTSFTTAFPRDDGPVEGRRVVTAEGARPSLSLPFWTYPAAVCGLPALSAPVGLSQQGLPVGVQVTAARWEDESAITFAELLAEVVGGYQRPPAAV